MMKMREYPAAVVGEIMEQQKAGFHLVDVDWWDLPIYDEYTLTFTQGAGDVRVVLLEVDKYGGAMRKKGPLDMNAGHFEHVAQVLEEKEEEHHAAV